MSRPMRIKLFTGSETNVLEQRINGWLDQIGTASVIRTETVVASVAANDGTYPCIVVTIWYEQQSSS
jgi:hypothetical protein